MKTRVFAVCVVVFLFCGFAHADSAKLVNPTNGHSYQRFDIAKIWPDAKTACANLGAHLATITSQVENNWVYTNMGVGGVNMWLGGTDEAQEGVWKWITGESWSYTNWQTGQPDNNEGSEDYLHMWGVTGGRWNDFHVAADSEFFISYLCEWDNSVCTDIAVKPHTFTTGTPAKAAEVNADFDTLYQQINTQNCQIQALKAIVCQDHPTADVCK
jgi:Lectin C-type domain